jgi:hypothetical protein
MKHPLIATALLLGLSGAAFAQTSAPSSNPSAHSHKATAASEPMGSSMTANGHVTPCSSKTSGTSDWEGGAGKASAASGGSDSNPGGNTRAKC